MFKSLAAESMDTIKYMFERCKHSHNCNCKDCLPLHLKINHLTAETGLDIMSDYCFTNGAKHLGAGIQQSIWSATNAG